MRHRYSRLVTLAAVVSACQGEPGTTAPTPPAPSTPPAPPVLLRDVVIPNLPAPYYHFEYDTGGRVRAASFASGLRVYYVTYAGDRITEVSNNVIVNHDTLRYSYDESDRVSAVRYHDSNGRIYAALIFSYEGKQLTGIERVRNIGSGFITDKMMSLSYYPDGNLLQITTHRPPIDGHQIETTTVDRFEQYDDKINVDGFSLTHDEFFDHLVLLPGVQLQKGNPARHTRTGDGLNFIVDYHYAYDDRNRPTTKMGELRLSNGDEAGRRFQTSSVFTYY